MTPAPNVAAVDVRVRGIVQGVGFRPHVYRLAHRFGVRGWVANTASGVSVHAEGEAETLDAFLAAIVEQAPSIARVESCDAFPASVEAFADFTIRHSSETGPRTTRIAPDLPVCDACLRELCDPSDRRYRYPYITCTNCGPRYSIVTGLPYDRPFTTMADWPMCAACDREYHDPADRRFHAQPLACPACGPGYALRDGQGAEVRGWEAFVSAAARLRAGDVVAVKGIGGFHLACDASNAHAVEALRARKYRKERPFAVMTRDAGVAESLVALGAAERALLGAAARPIVIAPARTALRGVAPDNHDLGVMLPYTPAHHLLFAAGAPSTLVMTSANRSSEPMAYEDADALTSLAGIADAFLIGERRVARRIDDSVAAVGADGPMILRRARGYTPQAVASVPSSQPILGIGGDLKNAVALAVEGQVFVSQHVGDLDHHPARVAFEATIRDLCAIYGVLPRDCLVAHDAHPGYVSSEHAATLGGTCTRVQHHRAHVASVIAERGAWDEDVVAFAFDGTGYGDDGTIWGGEVFAGSLRRGLRRVAHLAEAPLPGGDAAARFPVQAAAGFLWGIDRLPDVTAAPFDFPARYAQARELVRRNVRTFRTTSMGRLFDTVAALCGFTREVTFEGQAAIWLEQLALACDAGDEKHNDAYDLPFANGVLDFAPLLARIAAERAGGRDVRAIARGFHRAVAGAVVRVADTMPARPAVVSGGVFQNRLLLALVRRELGERLWTNAAVPPNDGGLCLGQIALAAVGARGAAAGC